MDHGNIFWRLVSTGPDFVGETRNDEDEDDDDDDDDDDDNDDDDDDDYDVVVVCCVVCSHVIYRLLSSLCVCVRLSGHVTVFYSVHASSHIKLHHVTKHRQ